MSTKINKLNQYNKQRPNKSKVYNQNKNKNHSNNKPTINLPTQKGLHHNVYKSLGYNQNVELRHNNKTTNIKFIFTNTHGNKVKCMSSTQWGESMGVETLF